MNGCVAKLQGLNAFDVQGLHVKQLIQTQPPWCSFLSSKVFRRLMKASNSQVDEVFLPFNLKIFKNQSHQKRLLARIDHCK